MRFLIVSITFPPEMTVSSRVSFDLAEELAAKGHDVVVIAPFPNRPSGVLFPGHRRSFLKTEHSGRYKVVHCFSFLSRNSTFLSRFMENISFGITSAIAVIRERRVAGVYSNTWPIISVGILAFVTRVRKIPLLISVQDIYPESLFAQRRIAKRGLFSSLLQGLDGLIVRSAAGVVLITATVARSYGESRRLPPSSIHVVPNWLGEEWSGPPPVPGAFRESLGIPADAFVFGYGGNLGTAASVETLISAFRHLSDLSGLHLLIGGSGTSLESCRTLAARIAPERIHFRSPWPAEETAALLDACDVLVLPTMGTQSIASVPSKVISYMMSGKPIIALASPQSDTETVIRDADAGWTLAPDDPGALAMVMREASFVGGAELARRGVSGRSYAQRNLSRQSGLPRLVSALTSIIRAER